MTLEREGDEYWATKMNSNSPLSRTLKTVPPKAGGEHQTYTRMLWLKYSIAGLVITLYSRQVEPILEGDGEEKSLVPRTTYLHLSK